MAKLIALFFSYCLMSLSHAENKAEWLFHNNEANLTSKEKSWLATHKVAGQDAEQVQQSNKPVSSASEPALKVPLSEDEKAWLSQHKVISIAFDASIPPYSFINHANQFEGIAVDIFNVLSKKLGISFKPYPKRSWNTLYEAAANRNVDVVATMVNRPERSFWFDFTQPYIKKSLVIVTRKDNPSIESRNDLAGKKIALVKDYQYSHEVKNEFPSIKTYFVDTMLDGLRAVSNRRTDAAILFTATANYLQKKYQIDDVQFADFYDRNSTDESIAVRKDWPLLATILQKGLDSISEKHMNAIYGKWVAPVVSPIVKAVPEQDRKQSETRLFPDLNALAGYFWKSASYYSLLAALIIILFLFRRQSKKIKLANQEAQNAINTIHQLESDLQRLIETRSAELSSNESTFRSLVENQNSEYFFYQYDCNGVFTYVSPSITMILGYSPDDFKLHYRDYLTDNPANFKVAEYIEECTKGIPNPPYQIEIYDAKKRIHWLEVNDSPVYDEYGICVGVDGVMHEITASKQTADHLIWLSYYDELTGLANRRLFMDRLQQLINLTHRKNMPVSLLFLDLERFKSINNIMGFTGGDEVLKEAAKRLLSVVRESDVAARLGGDEFALLLPETSKEAAALVAEKVTTSLQPAFYLGNHPVNLRVSIGIAVYPDDGKNCEALIKQADLAMYYAKKHNMKLAFAPMSC